MENTISSYEVIEHFNKWLLSKYSWKTTEDLINISELARKMIKDDLEYWADKGNSALYRAIMD